jgi:penicillin-binding protein 1C
MRRVTSAALTFFRSRPRTTAGLLLLFLFSVWFFFSLPDPLFDDRCSTVLESRNGELLSASIAPDGQWRFPESNVVPGKVRDAIVAFEDKRFFHHPGVDVLALGSAIRQNLSSGKVVRGASTLSMQVIRLSRKGQERTFVEKLYEMILALRLEMRYSKDEILQLYLSHAPFGGNVVGLEAACWRYFGRSEKDLSWGEAALLAVLPNAPSLIHPGKNRDALLAKRNRLLDGLMSEKKIDQFTCELAKQEPIPDKPLQLPRHARHLLARAAKEGKAGKKVSSTIDVYLQQRTEEVLADHQRRLVANEIHNAAAIIADVRTGDVLAYVGNASLQREEGSEVDVVTAPRSTGSILKPFLYAAALDEGKILMKSILPDIPTYINGFTPRNFSNQFDGAVAADEALIRSLNIPAVFLLREYRYEKFHALLSKIGMTTLTKPADHYGLSIILGGAEGTLWDIAGMYASAARSLNNYFSFPGKNRYRKTDYHPLSYTPQVIGDESVMPEESGYLSASAVYLTFEALKELYRPGEETGWKHFESAKEISWKTGTSFGFRDGWAIGVTANHVIGVWVGNADGEGRPGLTGVDAAAPVMFDLFSQLDDDTWFKRPFMEMEKITVCRTSGYRNSTQCEEIDSLWAAPRGVDTKVCSYHKKIHVSPDRKHQVNSACESMTRISTVNWFILPAVQEYYYRIRNISYKSPPPFREDCPDPGRLRNMDLVYPKPGARLFIPRDVTGDPGSVVFQLAHRNAASKVFWYLDGEYVGTTQGSHRIPLNPSSGTHKLVLVDSGGEFLEQTFDVLSDL